MFNGPAMAYAVLGLSKHNALSPEPHRPVALVCERDRVR